MLQNDAVRNLNLDSEIRVAQLPRLTPPVFDRPTHITSVPRNSFGIERIPLPISTVEQHSYSSNRSRTITYIPLRGYEVLADMPSVHIEQTFELNETLTSLTSENRYVVRSPLGEALFAASESSSTNQRLFWGAARPFQMHLLDSTHQEVLLLRKKLAIGMLCCRPKNLEVWAPPGDFLGRIVESPSFFSPMFFIEDGITGDPVFCLEGPSYVGFWCFCCMSKETYFNIHSGKDLRATIDRKWSSSTSQYTTNIYYSDATLSVREKALILGSAFLLEYMFFQGKL